MQFHRNSLCNWCLNSPTGILSSDFMYFSFYLGFLTKFLRLPHILVLFMKYWPSAVISCEMMDRCIILVFVTVEKQGNPNNCMQGIVLAFSFVDFFFPLKWSTYLIYNLLRSLDIFHVLFIDFGSPFSADRW